MRIGVDIDGVLTDYNTFCMEYGTLEYDVCDSNAYYFSKMFNISNEEYYRFFNKYRDIYSTSKYIRAFASEVLNKLKSEGNSIIIITARDFVTSENDDGSGKVLYTKKWLKDNNIPYDKIFFTPHDKVPTVLEEKIDVMIEDSPNNISSISKYIPVIRMDTRYNNTTNGKNIYPVYSWNEIYRLINKLK